MTTTMTTTAGRAANRQLHQRECWRLLNTTQVGRLSYSEAAMPVIRAVPFVVDGGSVVVAMRLPVLQPDLFADPTVVAFEAGDWRPGRHEGWSVRFVGKAEAVQEYALPDLLARGLTSWIEGGPALYVRIRAEILSGVEVTALS